jgi:hypothetical protein
VVSVEQWAGTLYTEMLHNACTTKLTIILVSVATKLNLKTVPYSVASLLSECFYAQVVRIPSLRLAIPSYLISRYNFA